MSSLTKATTTIDDLPVEMINELFRYLGLKDLAACSQVNKRWYSICITFRLDRLAVFDKFKVSKWNYPERKVEKKELCPLVVFNRLVGKRLLSNLKHLTLRVPECNFDTNKLNWLKHLVHLEIQGFSNKKVYLELPKLKILVAPSFTSSSIKRSLLIDCPELDVLIYNEYENVNLLEVKHPETIRKLVTNMIGAKLTRFKSVEYLVTDSFDAIRKDTLLSLSRLKELHYNADISKLWRWNSRVGTLYRVKGVLLEFLDHWQVLRGSDFKFTFAGFKLTKKMLEQIDFGVQMRAGLDGIEREEVSKEYIYMRNYQLIEPGALHFINWVDYSRLMDSAPEGIPDCFTQKFNRIEWVYARSSVQDEAYLLRFLKSLSSLRTLSLSRPELSQKFYDQLPASAHLLTELSLSGPVNRYREIKRGNVKELELNFHFIGGLSQLAKFDIYKFVPFESLSSLVRCLGRLRFFVVFFRLKERKFRFSNIRPTDGGSKVWQISEQIIRSPVLFKSENLDEILAYLPTLKSQILGSEASD